MYYFRKLWMFLQLESKIIACVHSIWNTISDSNKKKKNSFGNIQVDRQRYYMFMLYMLRYWEKHMSEELFCVNFFIRLFERIFFMNLIFNYEIHTLFCFLLYYFPQSTNRQTILLLLLLLLNKSWSHDKEYIYIHACQCNSHYVRLARAY